MDDTSLPKSFRNVRDEDIVRANLFSLDDIGAWIKEYQEGTSYIWYMWKSSPDQENCVPRAHFICQFSPLLDPENPDFKCPAEIRIEVTKELDEYTENGLPAVITFLDEHYHPLEAMTTIRSIFEKLFEHSMGRNESRLFYIRIMEHRLGRPVDDWAKPSKLLVKDWYDHWIFNRVSETKTRTDDIQTENDQDSKMEPNKDNENKKTKGSKTAKITFSDSYEC